LSQPASASATTAVHRSVLFMVGSLARDDEGCSVQPSVHRHQSALRAPDVGKGPQGPRRFNAGATSVPSSPHGDTVQPHLPDRGSGRHRYRYTVR
jgi:hypothetical protein